MKVLNELISFWVTGPLILSISMSARAFAARKPATIKATLQTLDIWDVFILSFLVYVFWARELVPVDNRGLPVRKIESEFFSRFDPWLMDDLSTLPGNRSIVSLDR